MLFENPQANGSVTEPIDRVSVLDQYCFMARGESARLK